MWTYEPIEAEEEAKVVVEWNIGLVDDGVVVDEVGW